ncbi:HAD family hydrolase [Salinigranum halophilum]|jgi:putative hydrolase of the HAD superfamily|uniref:HAD family hydrolase n=1 Tax=Salinigranum halophilum TaxID=2565931 RepID=UPI00115CCAC0|nr:HAD family hydrolase [Salinigranum halophilum]
MPPTAVAFDLDYTLAVPTRDRQTILSEAARVAGAPPLSREAYLAAHAKCLTEETREPIFATLLAEHDHDTEASPAAVAEAYRDLIAEALVPVAGVEGMLDTLRREYRVGLLTNGPVVAQHDKLRKLDWVGAFDVELVTGSLAAGKPDSRAFEALLSELGTPPEELVYVGDDVDADIEGAAAAGITPVQVTFDGSADPHPDAVATLGRDALATDLPALLTRL